MPQKIFQKILLLICVCFLAACGVQETETITPETHETPALPDTYSASIEEEKKVQLAIERRKEQTQIRKGDYMMTKNNPRAALEYYLPILAKLPDDIVLYQKIAKAYYGLKDWKNAYAYFVRVPISELTEEEISDMILSLFYSENAYDRTTELQKFAFTEHQREYYEIMSSCYFGIETCADKLWNYQWSEPRLLELQKIVKDSYKVTPDQQYRNLLIAQKLYEQKMFRIVGMITSEILANNPNYHEAKKMRAFSLYELGKYADARDLMLSYFQDNSDDIEVIIRLGETYTFLWDYKTANLYLNNAIMAGYTPKTILERRLAYNYAKLGDTEWMTKVLSYLLQEENVTEDDFAVAISLAIEKNDYNRAYSWAYAGIKKFPNSKILAPLYIQSLRLANKKTDALVYISGLSENMLNLPMVQLEKWILLFSQENFEDSEKIFDELIAYDENADFAIEAQEYKDKITEIKKQKEAEAAALSGALLSGSTLSGEIIQTEATSTNFSKNFWDD